MKKKTIILVALFVVLLVKPTGSKAQENTDSLYTGAARKGCFLVNAGIGFIEGVGGMFGVDYGLVGNRKTGVLTAGIFGSIMWSDWTSEWSRETLDRKYYSAGFRVAYRHDLVRRLEMYVAFWTGMVYLEDYAVSGGISYPYPYYDPNRKEQWAPYEKYPHNTFMWHGGGYLGFRYRFSDAVGLYVEGGYGVPVINSGFTFSL
jgi:hypothetical protein